MIKLTYFTTLVGDYADNLTTNNSTILVIPKERREYMNMRAEEIIDSVGIEMEFSSIIRDSREFMNAALKLVPGFQLDHDASCETPEIVLGNIPIRFKSAKDEQVLSGICRKVTIGGEIKSPISMGTSDEWVHSVYNLCELLKSFGETEESQRDSLHVHINVSKEIPLFVLKNLLRLTTSLEAIIFRLGGMGRMNRGESNDFIYQRPYLGNGPPVVWDYDTDGDNKHCYPVMNVDDLMTSTTKREFFERYGNAYSFAQKVRYTTCRYMVVNFYSILTYGSLEFRSANKTLNPDYILAWVNFARAFVEKAFVGRDESLFEQIARPLSDNREIPTHEFVTALGYLNSLDITTKNILLEIWMASPTPMFDNVWRFSHLPQPTRFGNTTNYRPKHIDPLIVKDARFVDLHVLEGDPPPIHNLDDLPVGLGHRLDFGNLDELRIRANNAPPLQQPFMIDVAKGLCDVFLMEQGEMYDFMWHEVNFCLTRMNHNGSLMIKNDWLYMAVGDDDEEYEITDTDWIEDRHFNLNVLSISIKDRCYDHYLPALLRQIRDDNGGNEQ